MVFEIKHSSQIARVGMINKSVKLQNLIVLQGQWTSCWKQPLTYKLDVFGNWKYKHEVIGIITGH